MALCNYNPEKDDDHFKVPGALLLLMPVFPQAFLALMGGHFMSFSFFSAWHGFVSLIKL